MPAELLINGRFATLHPGVDTAEAVLVGGERITYVGNRAEAEQLAAAIPGCSRTDLRGRRVIPGIFDMHAHLDREGLKSLHPAMAGIRTRRDVLQRISDLAAQAAPGSWIVTMPIGEPPYYFFQGAEEKALYPTREELDEAAPRNPVYIRPILGFWRWSPHPDSLVSVANSKALEAVGLRDDAQAPSTSVTLERDARGRLTGRFFEATTASIIELMYFARCVAFSHRDRVQGLRRSQEIASSFGITSIFEGHGIEPAVLAAYRELHASSEMSVRAELCHSPSWSTLPVPEFMERVADTLGGDGTGDDELRIRGLFVNPVPRGDDRIRASCGCYTGFAGYSFDSALPEAEFPGLLVELAKRNIRAVGLTRQLFKLYEKADVAVPVRGKRWMVQHCGALSDAEVGIAHRLELGLSFIPVEHIYKERGMSRGDRTWLPLRRLVDRGVRFTLATDNIPVSVFFAMWLCLVRRNLSGDAVPDPDGALDRIEVLKAATLWSAEALGCDDSRGSLAPGKLADLAVLDRDILECPVDDIKDTTAVATMRGGEWVHRRDFQ